MSEKQVPAPPPVPVRRCDVAARYLRLGEIAAEVRVGAYDIPADVVAAALDDEVGVHRQRSNGHHPSS